MVVRVLMNCAVDAKGRMAGPGGEPVRISSAEDLRRVHQMRAACDAILVGVGTVLRDDPSLRVKPELAKGPDPVRVVLDSTLRTPATARVLDGATPTRIYHSHEGSLPGANCVVVPTGEGGVSLPHVLHDLEEAGIRRLMVEGGPTVLRSFVAASLFDVWTVFQSPIDVGDGPGLWGGLPKQVPADLRVTGKDPVAGGVLWTFSPG